MASADSEEVNSEEVVRPNKRPFKKCDTCGGQNYNAAKRCKVEGCGAKINIKTFDWEKLAKKKKTHVTQQRKLLEYRANVLYQHHGWDVVVLYFNRHGKGTSVHTYGTPGAGQKFVGKNKQNASKYGLVTTRLYKQFSKEFHGSEHTIDDEPEDPSITVSVKNGTMSVVCTGVKPVSQDGNEANESQECSAEQPQQMAGAGGATIINQVPADIAQEQQLDGVGDATTSNQVVAQRAGPEQVDEDGSRGGGARHGQLDDGSSWAGRACSGQVDECGRVAGGAGPGQLDDRSGLGQVVDTVSQAGKAGSDQVHEGQTLAGRAGRGQVDNGSNQARRVGHDQGDDVGSRLGGAGRCQVNGGCSRAGGNQNGQVDDFEGRGVVAEREQVPVGKESDAVAYVVDGEILSVGIVDRNRDTLHGHKIERGMVCVLITYLTKPLVPAPLILGDPDENRHLQKGMFFVLPAVNLFKCEKYIAGKKVVLRKYICSNNLGQN